MSRHGERTRLIREETPDSDTQEFKVTSDQNVTFNDMGQTGSIQQKDPDPVSPGEESPVRNSYVLYYRRWVMLALFCCYSGCNAFQWNDYAVIQDVVITFYKPCLPADAYGQALVVTWLANTYFVGYVALIFPATWLLDKYGLRVSAMLGAGLNALGAAIKCASVGRNLMWVVYLGQITSSIAQVFLLGLPAHIAGAWFGENEVSTATAIGVFGNQVGIALGFLIPPVLVPQTNDIDAISRGFQTLNYCTAGFAIGIFLLVLIVFREKPPTPPSRAQDLATSTGVTGSYLCSLKNMFSNVNFVFLVLAYGTLTGVFYGLSLLISPILGQYLQNADKLAGRLGLTMVIAGIFGSVIAGVWLDRTKTYRFTTLLFNLMSVVGMFAFTFTLHLRQEWSMYATIAILGFFMTGYLPIGFEFAAEITYPEAEGISSGMLNMSAQFMGIFTTLGMQYLITTVSAFAANIAFCVVSVLAFIFAVFVKSDLRRLRASVVLTTANVDSSISSQEEIAR